MPLLAAVLAAVAGLACSPVAELGARDEGEAPLLPPARLEGVTLEGVSGGSRDVLMRAARARVDATTRIADLDDVHLSLARTERGPLELSAGRARVDLSRDDVVLEDGVQGRTREGETFRTRALYYDDTRARLHTDQPVAIERPNLTLRGDGMEMDLDAEAIRVLGRVRTQVDGR